VEWTGGLLMTDFLVDCREALALVGIGIVTLAALLGWWL